jgi:hypothetical protein
MKHSAQKSDIGALPDDWQQKKLLEIGDVIRGASPDQKVTKGSTAAASLV